MHHPPIISGIPAMDDIRLLQGTTKLADIVRQHPRVGRLLTGHLHRSIQAPFAGTICQIAASVADQTAADFAAVGELRTTLEPPAFLLHECRADGEIVSHTIFIEAFAVFQAG